MPVLKTACGREFNSAGVRWTLNSVAHHEVQCSACKSVGKWEALCGASLPTPHAKARHTNSCPQCRAIIDRESLALYKYIQYRETSRRYRR